PSVLGKEVDRGLAVTVIVYVGGDDATEILGERFGHMPFAARRFPHGHACEIGRLNPEYRKNAFDQGAGGPRRSRELIEAVRGLLAACHDRPRRVRIGGWSGLGIFRIALWLRCWLRPPLAVGSRVNN